MLGNKDANIAVTTTYVFDTREWMGPGGLHGLQIRWQAAFAVCGGFDSLALPPEPISKTLKNGRFELKMRTNRPFVCLPVPRDSGTFPKT